MKKIYACSLAMVLLLMIFAGCGTVNNSSPVPGGGADAPLDEEAAEQGEEVSTGEPAVELPAAGIAVHFIDVGQGDAVLIQTPEQNVLVDGGERGTVVVDYLSGLGVAELDLVVATHPHADHIGGLINVFASIPVNEVIDPGVVHTTKLFEEYLLLIDKQDILFTEGRAGMTRELGGGVRMIILHPEEAGGDVNESSIVVKVTFGQFSLLLTGDAGESSEKQILARGYDLKGTVLKVGHHGSRSSTGYSFLGGVAPEVAVIMVGRDNKYGHPHEETLLRLVNAGVDIYRTDIHGTIVITSDGQTFDINQKQPYQFNPPKIIEPESGPVREAKTKLTNMININTAGIEELQKIIHIGPVRAREIIELRPFSSVEELTRVSGIGMVRLEDIKSQGIAYTD